MILDTTEITHEKFKFKIANRHRGSSLLYFDVNHVVECSSTAAVKERLG